MSNSNNDASNINPEDLVEGVSKVRSFIDRHSTTITTVATVSSVLILRRQRKDLHKLLKVSGKGTDALKELADYARSDLTSRAEQAGYIETAIKEGRDFTFFPGVGVWVGNVR